MLLNCDRDRQGEGQGDCQTGDPWQGWSWVSLSVAWMGIGRWTHQDKVTVLGRAILGRQLLDVTLLDQLIGGVDNVLLPTQSLVYLQELVHFFLQETQGSGRCTSTRTRGLQDSWRPGGEHIPAMRVWSRTKMGQQACS